MKFKFKGTTLTTPFEEILSDFPDQPERPKTFKEQLAKKADEFERQADVPGHIKAIKAKMEKIASQRKFYIYLIEPTSTSPLAFGCQENAETIFIPRNIVAWRYVQMFKEALKELGFELDNGISSTSIKSETDYDCWTITLEW